MKFIKAILTLFSLKHEVSSLVAQVNSLSPSPAPRNREERRMLARKGHL